MNLSEQIKLVKISKATKRFWDLVKVYGRESSVIRALDSVSREEAIQTIAIGIKYSVSKINGQVVVQ